MAKYTWPSTGRHRPENVVEHATCLKTEFDLVSNTANASLSNTTLLPSGLESRISRGITKGMAEACRTIASPKWSDVDKSIFSKVMLKNITVEAALEARDRIPLPLFHGLHESYNALHAKLATQMLSAATTHQFVGADAATGATSVVDLVNAARKTSEETDLARERVIAIRQEEKVKDVRGEESMKDTSEEEESEMDEYQDARDVQEGIESGDSESGDSESGDDSREDGSSDDRSVSEEESEEDSKTDSDAGSEEEETLEIIREESVPNINGDGSGFSTTINLQIEQQASVNQLEGMTALELSDCLSSSLQKFLRKQQLPSRGVHISDISLLDNGDVKVFLHTETREALQQFIDSSAWDQDFERTLTGSPISTYRVRMHKVEINSLKFKTRKEKSAIIRKLIVANAAIGQVNNVRPIIRDIRWSQYSLPKVAAALVVEFSDPEQATQALVRGLYWQERRHGCERAENKFRLFRCIRCQGYGHLFEKCSAPHRCGKCAGHHRTATCNSETRKCGSCGGGHYAGSRNCPAKAKARKSLGFPKETTSQATEPAAEAQATPTPRVRHSISVVRAQTETSMPSPVSLDADAAEDEVKSECDQALPKADPTPDTYPDTATLLKQIEDIRRIVVARDTALQNESSGRTKRQAGDAFGDEAEAESSNMAAKRIKQE